MSLPKDYTGPTSGRFRVGPQGVSKRETFTQESDPPLTRDELNATEEFRALGPNEQIRAYRLAKWNEDVQRAEARAWKDISNRQVREIAGLLAQLATFTPEGFTFPPAARDLLDHAAAHGWKSGRAWTVDETDPAVASLKLIISRDGWTFDHLRWSCGKDGGGRMTSRGIVRAPRQNWRDAPSLKKIKEIIATVASEQEEKGS
jgi:hypothetical protein